MVRESLSPAHDAATNGSAGEVPHDASTNGSVYDVHFRMHDAKVNKRSRGLGDGVIRHYTPVS